MQGLTVDGAWLAAFARVDIAVGRNPVSAGLPPWARIVKDARMRTHRWIKALAFGCCLGAGADAAFAQAPFPGGGVQGQWVTADGSPAPAPGMYQPPGAANNPAMIYPPGTPGDFAPWPQISPYGPPPYGTDSTYNKRGLWFREFLSPRRDYYFNIDALNTTTRAPGDALIGAETIGIDPVTRGPRGYDLPTYGIAPYPTTGGGGAGGGTGGGTATIPPLSQVNVDRGVNPFPFMRPSATGDPEIQIIDTSVFPVRGTKNIFNDFNTAGLQLEWGYEDEDGSGLRIGSWWAFQGDQVFQRGTDQINGIIIDQQLILDTEGQILFTRNGAVTFDTGIPVTTDPDQQGIFGSTVGAQKYDVMYRADIKSQSGGGDLQMYLPDLFPTTSAIRLRPVYGLKYTFINETFDFRGIDSGLSYDIGTGAGGGGGGGGGQNNQTSTFRPDPWGTGGPNSIDSDLFETQVNSRVRTHLAGPTAGVRYDFGRSRSFKLWGQSNFGLMANYEEARVNGFNAGENLVTRFLLGTNMLDGDSTFSDSKNHAHVSPLFEQTFMSESKILAALPLTKEVPILANANLRIGYTATFVGFVARPANSINWLGFPRSPKVDIDYQTWSQGRWNFGLEWTY
jgi:hypothetical protein